MLARVEPGQPLGLTRGDCVVCIPYAGGNDSFSECLYSVLRHTPDGVVVCIADDASPDNAPERLLEDLATRGLLDLPVLYIRQPRRLGSAESLNSVLRAAAPADLLLLSSDCAVSGGWFDGMRAAAYSDTTVATATALTNHGGLLSVPQRNRPVNHLPHGWTLDLAASAVRSAALGLRPTIPVGIGHCMYVTRSAFDIVGGFDPAFELGRGAETDFTMRCVNHGLRNVAADDVFVFHHSTIPVSSDLGAGGEREREEHEEHEAILASRYPSCAPEVLRASSSTSSGLALALGAARRALTGLSVTIDGSCLGPLVMGTQVHALGVIVALARRNDVHVRVAIPKDCGPYARDVLMRLHGVDVLGLGDVGPQTVQTDIVYCPLQVSDAHHLRTLRCMGERLVISQLDFIAYRNPSYHATDEAWEAYRTTTRLSLRTADRVVFLSEHSAADALSEGLVDPAYGRVVHPGTDHDALPSPPATVRPAGAPDLESHELILCLGADYHHKNRVFALRVLDELQRAHGWDGRLVLAGVRVQHGSSAGEEAAFLLRHPDVDAATVRLATVSEEEKSWLMDRARLILYPSAHEGFGFVPFEAARAGIPTLFAPQSSLAEVAPASAAMIVPWAAVAAADRAIALMQDAEARRCAIDELTAAAEDFSWDRTADELVRVCEEAARSWPRVSDLSVEEIVRTLLEAQDEVEVEPVVVEVVSVEPTVTDLGLCLVGPQGSLSVGTQEMLWALARRPMVGRVMLDLPTMVYRRVRGAMWRVAGRERPSPPPADGVGDAGPSSYVVDRVDEAPPGEANPG